MWQNIFLSFLLVFVGGVAAFIARKICTYFWNKYFIKTHQPNETKNLSLYSLQRDMRKPKVFFSAMQVYSNIGYNIYIERDGSVHLGRPFGAKLAHARGHNKGFLAICYEGGLDAQGNPKDTRTDAQKQALITWRLFIERIYDVIRLNFGQSKNAFTFFLIL